MGDSRGVMRFFSSLWREEEEDFTRKLCEKVNETLTLNGTREFFTHGTIHCWKSDMTTWQPTTTSRIRLIRNLSR